MSNIDHELQAHFDALRAEDQAALPAFGSMVQGIASAPTATPLRRAARAGWWLAAAGVLIASTTLLVRRTSRPHEDVNAVLRDTAMLRRLSSWTSPTDGLLQMPNTLRITPRVLDSADRLPTIHRSSRRK
jgi:hypothetical protein